MVRAGQGLGEDVLDGDLELDRDLRGRFEGEAEAGAAMLVGGAITGILALLTTAAPTDPNSIPLNRLQPWLPTKLVNTRFRQRRLRQSRSFRNAAREPQSRER